MTSAQQLKALLQAAQACTRLDEVARAQDAFFSALLDATLYAHLPPEPSPPGRIRFVQFVRPDNGQTVLPLFSDREQAEAVRGNRAIVAMTGRELLELTRGATLMLNPNGDQIVLYPAEVDAILAGQSIGKYSREDIRASEEVGACPPAFPTDALTLLLRERFAIEPAARAAYLVELHRGPEMADVSLLLGIVAAAAHQQRLLQLTTLWIKPVLETLPMPLMMTLMTPEEELPEFFHHGIQFYGT